jgi:hypothetical protein
VGKRRSGVRHLKFKTEVCLLSLALSLFVVSAFFYSYQTGSASLALNGGTYPYQGYSLALVAFGSVLTLVAFASYSKRGKNIYIETLDFSRDDKSN